MTGAWKNCLWHLDGGGASELNFNSYNMDWPNVSGYEGTGYKRRLGDSLANINKGDEAAWYFDLLRAVANSRLYDVSGN